MFAEDIHVLTEIPWQAVQRGKWYISLDYGTVNPTAAGLWCIYLGTAYMVDEYYYDSRAENGKRRTDEEHYAGLEKLAGERKIERVIVDPSAASFKETIRRHGKFSVWDADNSVLDGIRLTGTLLQAGRLKFHKNCKGIIDEFAAYRWNVDAPEDAVIKEFDHCLTGDTLIDTLDGPVRIDELLGKSGLVYCADGDSPAVGHFSNVRMTQEEAEIFELVLADGRRVKATADHPVLTRRGWTAVKDLRTDDEIACIGGLQDEHRIQSGQENSII